MTCKTQTESLIQTNITHWKFRHVSKSVVQPLAEQGLIWPALGAMLKKRCDWQLCSNKQQFSASALNAFKKEHIEQIRKIFAKYMAVANSKDISKSLVLGYKYEVLFASFFQVPFCYPFPCCAQSLWRLEVTEAERLTS